MNGSPGVAVLVGSLRADSLTRKLARALVAMAPEGLSFCFPELGDLPLYNDDLEAEAPAAWTRFRDEVRSVRGVVFVTPEYNRSIPGALKNAIDVGSRPSGRSVFAGKPAAVISQSPGAIGGFGANQALRQCLVFLDMPVLQQPEAYVGATGKIFNEDGSVGAEGTRAFLRSIISAYAAWLERLAPCPAA